MSFASRRRQGREVGLDDRLPVLHFKIGRAPIHHGVLGVIRSLGRAGVAVFANTEDRLTPAAVSRYLTRPVIWTPDVFSDRSEMLARLVTIGREIGGRPVIVCTDDEAAVLVAEGAQALRVFFTLPAVSPQLPRQLASKRGLNELCRLHEFPTPHTAFPSTRAELATLVGEMRCPVVVKNVDPWLRISEPVVPGSTIVRNATELLERASRWEEPFGCLVQEYLPEEFCEDWVVHGYCGDDTEVVLTARRLRSWPPFAGQTASARLEDNPELTRQVRSFCRQIGYRGIFDVELRLDHRDGVYYLFDFNPRVGAPMCLFETDAAIDVVRAMHLDLSGRPVPDGQQLSGRRLIVEHLDFAARPAYRRARATSGISARGWADRGPLRLAWFAADDPLPFVAMIFRQLWWSLRTLVRRRLGKPRSRPKVERPGRAAGSGGHSPSDGAGLSVSVASEPTCEGREVGSERSS